MREQTAFWAAATTIVVWVAVTSLAVVFMIFTKPEALGAAIFVFLMAAMGVGGTVAIWEAVGKTHSQPEKEPARTELRKAKRGSDAQGRIERLVESLDEDEIVELETLLLAREDDALRK
jgi:hypothetical protein